MSSFAVRVNSLHEFQFCFKHNKLRTNERVATCQWCYCRIIFHDLSRKREAAINKKQCPRKSHCENLFNGSFVISDLCHWPLSWASTSRLSRGFNFSVKTSLQLFINTFHQRKHYNILSRLTLCYFFTVKKFLIYYFLFHLCFLTMSPNEWMSSVYMWYSELIKVPSSSLCVSCFSALFTETINFTNSLFWFTAYLSFIAHN